MCKKFPSQRSYVLLKIIFFFFSCSSNKCCDRIWLLHVVPFYKKYKHFYQLAMRSMELMCIDLYTTRSGRHSINCADICDVVGAAVIAFNNMLLGWYIKPPSSKEKHNRTQFPNESQEPHISGNIYKIRNIS